MARGSFTKTELASFEGATVPDLMPPDRLRLLIVGINPGLWTAASGAHFARPGNRFWPALERAGILPHTVDASAGLDPNDEALLIERGIGITNLVPVATARADQLTTAQLRAGGEALRAVVRARAPRVVAMLGITAFRAAFGTKCVQGRQDDDFEGAELWVLPNPSGLNAHETTESLAVAYRAAAVAAGIVNA
ncbi:MAG: mismatch-specific DNA-glycosylase [Ilumatobacteraceae bacterium]